MTDKAVTLRSDSPLLVPQEYAGYGVLDTSSGRIHLFAHVIERLNISLGQFGYEVSAVLESMDALKALVHLEKAIKDRGSETTEDVFYDSF